MKLLPLLLLVACGGDTAPALDAGPSYDALEAPYDLQLSGHHIQSDGGPCTYVGGGFTFTVNNWNTATPSIYSAEMPCTWERGSLVCTGHVPWPESWWPYDNVYTIDPMTALPWYFEWHIQIEGVDETCDHWFDIDEAVRL